MNILIVNNPLKLTDAEVDERLPDGFAMRRDVVVAQTADGDYRFIKWPDAIREHTVGTTVVSRHMNAPITGIAHPVVATAMRGSTDTLVPQA